MLNAKRLKENQMEDSMEQQENFNSENLEFLDFLDSLEESSPREEAVKEQEVVEPQVPVQKTQDHQPYKEKIKITSVQLDLPKLKVPQEHPLKSFAFVHKLYLATSSERVPFLNWSADGLELIVQVVGLQQHLASPQNLFSSGSVSQFSCHLLELGFLRVWSKELQEPANVSLINLIYKHASFMRDQPEELHAIDEVVNVGEHLEPAAHSTLTNPSASHLARTSARGDLCSTFHATRSPLQVARARLQTVLRYQTDLQLLQEQVNSKEPLSNPIVPRRGRLANCPQPSLPLRPSSMAANYVKPHESVLRISPGQVPEYAGYYGSVDKSLVSEFFGEYLPRYGNKINGEKDILMDATNKVSAFQQNLPIGVDFTDEEDNSLLEAELEEPVASTSAAAFAGRKSAAKRAAKEEDDHIQQALNSLCSDDNEDEGPKVKPKPKPKTKKKRLAKFFASSSSEEEQVTLKQPYQINIRFDNFEAEKEKQVEIVKPAAKVTKTKKSKKMKSPSEEEKMEVEAEAEDENGERFEDDDFNDKNVKYRKVAQPAKRRRYDLRNSKRSQ